MSTPPPDHAPQFAERSFRPDIEGLRAIAVVAVLLYHVQIGPFGGGFVGVDVFFVLSGYLITSLMAKEIADTGRLSLTNFWGRRARRLLPASAIVVVFVLIASRLLLDPITHQGAVTDAFAASLFVVNWVFAAGDPYFAVDAAQSPLLHFWSLAVEEQFYLLWPVALWGLSRLRRAPWRVIRTVCAVAAAVSLAVCLWWTANNQTTQQWAFYLLPARAWELLAGAALALHIGPLMRVDPRVRMAMGWIGVAGIIAVTVGYRDGQPTFPGWAAILPVLYTGMVVAASNGDDQVGPAGLLGHPVMLWLGARSYSIYLWHWPLWVIVDARTAGTIGLSSKLAVVGATMVLAELSYRFVEQPIRHHPGLARSSPASLLLGGRIIAAVAWLAFALAVFRPALATTATASTPRLVPASAPQPAGTTAPTSDPASQPGVTVTSVGAPSPGSESLPDDVTATRRPPVAALVATNQSVLADAVNTSDVPSNLRPGLGGAFDDKPSLYSNGCLLEVGQTATPLCVFGDASSSTHVVLFGDSHAAQWFPAFSAAATNNGWLLEVHTKRGCPTADITLASYDAAECARWRANVVERLSTVQPDLIVMTAYRYKPGPAEEGLNSDSVWKRGLETTLSAFRPTTTNILLLGDTPTPRDDVIQCLGNNLSNAGRCVRDRASAVKVGRLTVEAELAAQFDIDFEPTSDWLCTPTSCPVIIGDVLVYRDHNHITTTAAAYLTPLIEATVLATLAS
jgi:peptidoglycan/LPS O-acetylase OafA/YrhL